MNINQIEKDKLYRGFELFKEAFSSYIISLLKRKLGEDWKKEFLKTLSPNQLQVWEKKEKRGKNPENLIDFQHFKYFAIKNKDLLRDDFEEKTERLPTLLEEIIEARNSYAHFDSIEEDEAMKAWINMRSIAKLLGMSELEQEIRSPEKGNVQAKSSVPELEKPAFNPLPIHLVKDKIKAETQTPKQSFIPVQPTSGQMLDIVNCANPDFRKTVISHNVYLCPAQGGAYKHKQCKYLGVYWEKQVGAVAEIEAVIDVYSIDKAFVYFNNGDQNVQECIATAKEKALKLRPNHLPIRVFLLKKLHSTNFTKDSPGGMFGSKIHLDIENLEATDAEDLAKKLQGKKYSDFGLETKKDNTLEFIASAVLLNPDLSVKEVPGGYHRIMKSGWHGSLWINKTATRGYRIVTTGSTGTTLNPEIKLLLGRDNDEETAEGYKVWFVENKSDVEKVISLYGQL